METGSLPPARDDSSQPCRYYRDGAIRILQVAWLNRDIGVPPKADGCREPSRSKLRLVPAG